MKIINIVAPQAILRTTEIAEADFNSATALNQALRVSISEEEFETLFGADRLKMSIDYDVQDEELFFSNISLDRVISESSDYLVFCGGCVERNGSFYSVTAVIYTQNPIPEIRLYFSIAY